MDIVHIQSSGVVHVLPLLILVHTSKICRLTWRFKDISDVKCMFYFDPDQKKKAKLKRGWREVLGNSHSGYQVFKGL